MSPTSYQTAPPRGEESSVWRLYLTNCNFAARRTTNRCIHWLKDRANLQVPARFHRKPPSPLQHRSRLSELQLSLRPRQQYSPMVWLKTMSVTRTKSGQVPNQPTTAWCNRQRHRSYDLPSEGQSAHLNRTLCTKAPSANRDPLPQISPRVPVD